MRLVFHVASGIIKCPFLGFSRSFMITVAALLSRQHPSFLFFDHSDYLDFGKTTLLHLFAPSMVEQILHSNEGSFRGQVTDTIQVFVPLKLRKKNGRPKILPSTDYLPSEDQTQDPHILRAIGRAWAWRRRMEAGEFGTVRDLPIAVNFAEGHVSRQLRLAYLAPEVLKRLVFSREVTAVRLYDLCFLTIETWHAQVKVVFTDRTANEK